MHPFTLLAWGLSYPDAELLAARRELARAAHELPHRAANDELTRFISWWADAEPATLQHTYVATFDFARRTALDLTYYTHGDRRQRGLALVALRRRYAAAGLELDTTELPDHLPLMLEFTTIAPEEGGALLAEYRPVIELLRLALERDNSPYQGALRALCLTLPALTPDEHEHLRRIAREGPPDETVGLEPFAPPEVMPETRRAPAACAVAPGAPR
ncbi:MAG TPA: nitrate reductase molybdenum cofactor assembly chaperone [Miltoncostaeaceae bacterium]|nr:nitrate reductase molybdenum cofactor assembly chaperone [Miltoncostaeaceae bacterium]